jgi:guanyl-specific ribonuclease Sa
MHRAHHNLWCGIGSNVLGITERVESHPIRLGCVLSDTLCVVVSEGGDSGGDDEPQVDTSATTPPPGGPFKDPNLWEKVKQVLENIARNIQASGRDGSTFYNREGKLPAKPDGYYSRYTIPAADGSPGTMRMVLGQGGEQFFTPNHYGSFFQF